jgi:hypothetical protein
MTRIFAEVERRAIEESGGAYQNITVNTYPAKFESMPRFLESRDYKVTEITRQYFSKSSANSNSEHEEMNFVEKYSYQKILQR